MISRTVKVIEIERRGNMEVDSVIIEIIYGNYTRHVWDEIKLTQSQWDTLKKEAVKEYLDEQNNKGESDEKE